MLRKTLLDPAEVDAEIRKVRGGWLHRDATAYLDDWDEAISLIDNTLPAFEPIQYTQFNEQWWTHLLKRISAKSARGSCGFTATELKLIPVSMLPALFRFMPWRRGHLGPNVSFVPWSFVCQRLKDLAPLYKSDQSPS